MVGLEPTRPHGHKILSLARLPFHHTGIAWKNYQAAESPEVCKAFGGPKISRRMKACLRPAGELSRDVQAGEIVVWGTAWAGVGSGAEGRLAWGVTTAADAARLGLASSRTLPRLAAGL